MSAKDVIKSVIWDFCNGIDNLRVVDSILDDLFGKYWPSDEQVSDPAIMAYYRGVVVPHKVEVYKAGIEIGTKLGGSKWSIPSDFIGQLLHHDLSKFSKEEAAYATHNFKDKSQNSEQQVIDFEVAWNHHKHHNPHHPEHWICIRMDGGLDQVLPMPYKYVLEMVADWVGAGRTYGNTLENWLPNNIQSFLFHDETINHLQFILGTAFGIKIKHSGNGKCEIIA